MDIIENAAQLNDFNRKSGDGLPAVPSHEERRASLRKLVRGYLKYTVRGQRGAGRTDPRTLAEVRNARRNHTLSIHCQRAGWV